MTIFATAWLSVSANAQAPSPAWYWQNPLPQGNHIVTLSFVDTSMGFAAGLAGTILRTTNGGVRWELISSGTTRDLFGINMADSSRGWAVGDSGIILRTTDGGTSWIEQHSGSMVPMNDVGSWSADSAVVVGNEGTILRTTNGGITWSAVVTPTRSHLKSISTVPNGIATTVGNSAVILRTTDGGVQWSTQTGPGFGYLSVDLWNADTGAIVGYRELVLGTTDGGTSWVQQTIPDNLSDDFFYAVACADGKTRTAVSVADDRAWMYRSTDGGLHWKFERYGLVDYLYALEYPSSSVGYGAGRAGRILRTPDGGDTWIHQTIGTSMPMRGISFVGEKLGFAVGWSTILRTMDGGATWEDVSDRTVGINVTNALLWKVDRVDSLVGFVCGESGIMLRTTNGGDSWHLQSTNAYDALLGISFTSPMVGMTVGRHGEIQRTTDGGATWEKVATGLTTDDLNAVHLFSGGIAVAVSYTGTVYRSTDFGWSWSSVGGAPYGLSGLSFSDSVGTAVGNLGVALRTTDGGISWRSSPTNVGIDLRAVLQITGTEAVATGLDGTVIRTTDGGDTWRPEWVGTRNGVYELAQTELGSIALVGDHGMVLHSDRPASIRIPDPPLLAFPINGAVEVPLPALLWWHGSSRASGYEVTVARDPQFHSVVFRDLNVNQLSRSIPGLEGDSTFFWKVSARNTLGSSEPSATRYFRTLDRPTPPALSYPANGAVGVSTDTQIRWHPSPKTDSYRLQISRDTSFMDLASDHRNLTDTVVVTGWLDSHTIYYWRVSASNLSGEGPFSERFKFSTIGATSVEHSTNTSPTSFSLYQNYPNPANPSTTFEFSIPWAERISLTVYNSIGSVVESLLEEEVSPGIYRVEWNSAGHASGVYFVRLRAGARSATIKILLLR